jgi:hypothetical protein
MMFTTTVDTGVRLPEAGVQIQSRALQARAAAVPAQVHITSTSKNVPHITIDTTTINFGIQATNTVVTRLIMKRPREEGEGIGTMKLHQKDTMLHIANCIIVIVDEEDPAQNRVWISWYPGLIQ